jgi:hypothetical protein
VAEKTLPIHYSRDRLRVGLDAFAGLIFSWSGTGEGRIAATFPSPTDMAAYARIFRNDLQNMDLEAGISDRTAKRERQRAMAIAWAYDRPFTLN